MATSNLTPIPEELKTILHEFETFLYTHCKVNMKTAANYLGAIRRAYPVLGSNPVHADIENYVADLRRAGITSSYLAGIETALERFCEFRGNPIDLTRPPKGHTEVPITLSEAEVAVFLHSSKNLREKTILGTLAYSGMRNNELCSLRIRDVDLGSGIIRIEIGKFNKQRIVGIAGECIALLVQFLQTRGGDPDDFLFLTERRKLPLEPQDIRKMVRRVAKRAGIARRIWPHLFRHSLATNMLDRGAHLLTVRDQLGHVFVDSTMVYVHRSKKTHSNDYRHFAPSYI